MKRFNIRFGAHEKYISHFFLFEFSDGWFIQPWLDCKKDGGINY